MANIKPTLLIIRDGWGSNHNDDQEEFDAIRSADTPISDALSSSWPRTEITAHGLDVGLPEGVMGNSEVGHQNIGAGRIVDQEIVRIDKAFANGELHENTVLKQLFKKKRIHLMGLASDAGVHSVLRHMYHILDLAKQAGVPEVFIHAFTDGRDTPPKSGYWFIEQIEAELKRLGIGKIASVCGRFWAMDRDHRWDRIKMAYNCLTGKEASNTAKSPLDAIEYYYNKPLDNSRQGDEFILPTWIVNKDNNPIGPIQNNDGVLFFNFRGDRPRELCHAFLDNTFKDFDRGPKLKLFFATLTQYQSGLCENTVFPRPPKMKHILGDVISQAGLKQFRCAETEKYPHVTFFFNDYREDPFPDEDRSLVPSPRDVPTYDLKPEMSAYAVKDEVINAIRSAQYSLIIVNFANPDMVGHTGDLDATIKAVETVDSCVGDILEALDEVGGSALITADHGNADLMWNESAELPHTQHTLNPVELVLYGYGHESKTLRESGRLADIAPTLLDLLNIEKPVEMTGVSLIN